MRDQKVSLTSTVELAGCFNSMRRSPSSCSRLTSASWDSKLLFLKFWGNKQKLFFLMAIYRLVLSVNTPPLWNICVCVASWPHTLCEYLECPPCGHSSPAWGSYSALHSGTSALSCSRSCSRTDCSGNVAAIWSYPVRRCEPIIYLLLVPCEPTSHHLLIF